MRGSCRYRVRTAGSRPADLTAALAPYHSDSLHQMPTATVSITQPTEVGTLYDLAGLEAIEAIARTAGMKLHMDGARFANALITLDTTPGAMTWQAGIDTVSFGTTKNGTMNAEAVLCFDYGTAHTLRVLTKRAGCLQSKMRYAPARLLGYLNGDLWCANARAANANALRIAAAVTARPGPDSESVAL